MDSKPNILLITTDQQRHDTVGPAAPSFMRTPHQDLLAREGITYSAAYADSAVCVPARVGIMTGKYVSSHGIYNNSGRTLEVIGREENLPSLLRDQGYQTAAIGKMHFTPERARHGFDEMILPADYYNEMAKRGYDLQPMRHGLGQNELYPTMATVPEAQTLTAWIAEQCVEYIKVRRDPTIPFFLWCSFSKPHPPLDPPEPYYSMYRNCPIPEPVYGDWSDDENCPEPIKRFRQEWSNDLIPPEIIREARAAYYGLVTQIDYNMGRVFAALQDLGLFGDTLILFTSDHGEYLGDHHCGAKTFFHESSAHVPFFVRMPKNWDNRCHGTTISTPVTHADLLPTIVKAAGGEIPQSVDGLDLVGLARGVEKPRVYLEAGNDHPDQEYYGITDGRWKYIWYPEGASEQFFDLKNDPQELVNLSAKDEYKAQMERLKEELVRRHVERNSKAVKDGKLVSYSLRGDSTRDRRNRSWPGFHTEHFDVDVRH